MGTYSATGPEDPFGVNAQKTAHCSDSLRSATAPRQKRQYYRKKPDHREDTHWLPIVTEQRKTPPRESKTERTVLRFSTQRQRHEAEAELRPEVQQTSASKRSGQEFQQSSAAQTSEEKLQRERRDAEEKRSSTDK